MSSRRLPRIASTAVACLFLAWAPAIAQTLDETEHRLPPPPELREDASAPAPAVEARADAAPAEALPPFTLTAIAFRGATAFEPRAFAPLYDAYLARTVTIKDLRIIAEAITGKYREHGYFLSRAIIPAQTIENGLVTIEIVEGYVSEIVVEGGHSKAAEAIALNMTKSRPARLSELERTVLLINDLSGVTVRETALRPDIGDLRRHTLALTIETSNISARLYTDNRGTADVGRLQSYLQVAAHSLLQSADMLAGGLFFTPDRPEELVFAQASYTTPIGGSGLYATIYGARSAVHPDRNPPDESSGHSVHSLIRLSYPLMRTRRMSLWGNLGFETRDVREDEGAAIIYKDRLRDINASAYLVAKHAGGVSTVYVEAVNGVVAERPPAIPVSRADADGRFVKVRFEATRTQTLAGPFEVHLALAGQAASDALLSSEEFAFGGARYGRGFDYAAMTGDDAVAGLAELRFTKRPDLPLISSVQMFAFYDAATVWNKNVAPGGASLSSAGLGLRLFFEKDFLVSYEAARPIDGVTGDFGDEEWRHFFSIAKSF